MPLYEDLVRRALEAGERAWSLGRDSRLIRELAQTLRDAEAGKMTIRRCAWCHCFHVGGEWLRLEAVGAGQQRIRASLLDNATHGICEDCLAVELEKSSEARKVAQRANQVSPLQ